jgi:hypothetical protein
MWELYAQKARGTNYEHTWWVLQWSNENVFQTQNMKKGWT